MYKKTKIKGFKSNGYGNARNRRRDYTKSYRFSLHGFTLIELLVVISIIAILMAILMPALGKVRQQAVGLVCRTQFKDIGTSVRLYMQDNDDKMVANYYEPMANGTKH
jgi:prepilin-type N-terminal cleavage/methylation domain-containing protein